MKSNRDYIDPDLSTFSAAIARSRIVVTLEAVQRFPAGFDAEDVAILKWIAAKTCHVKRTYF